MPAFQIGETMSTPQKVEESEARGLLCRNRFWTSLITKREGDALGKLIKLTARLKSFTTKRRERGHRRGAGWMAKRKGVLFCFVLTNLT